MRVEICLIGGFLESGKTTFINGLLESRYFMDGKKTVLICCEHGIAEYRERVLKASNTTLVNVTEETKLNEALFVTIFKEYAPDRILIEYNGTWEIESFLKLKLPAGSRLDRIISLADLTTFRLYMSNMGTIMTEHFSNSDTILLNNWRSLDIADRKSIVQMLKAINRQADIRTYDKKLIEAEINKIYINKGKGMSIGKTLLLFTPLLPLYLLSVSPGADSFKALLPRLQSINTVFLSILLQALPFILIGVFVASFLQVFISDDKFIWLFTRYQGIGYMLSILLGVCLPVCDCAMAPITARLVRKGVPVHFVIIFLLAAPVVNPVVILSTLYAFPEDYRIALFRLGLGISIALLTGFIIRFCEVKKQNIIKDYLSGSMCAVGNPVDTEKHGIFTKLNMFFSHVASEFFKVSKYVIAGAFITSLIQNLISPNSLIGINNTPMLALIIMTAASLLMSVCSTSNAFIARSFSYSFPLYSVIFYMVMGPMLDLKNLLMLSGSYKKKFLAELVLILCVLGIFVFSCGAGYI